MAVMPQLFVTVAELSSEACWSIVFMHPDGYAVLYRPEFDGNGAEGSLLGQRAQANAHMLLQRLPEHPQTSKWVRFEAENPKLPNIQ